MSRNKEIIPVFFTFNRGYVIPAIVAIYSLLRHADKTYFYKLYVLHTDLLEKDQQKLQEIIQKFPNQTCLNFIDVKEYHDIADWNNLNSKQHYSKEIYNKLIAEKLFPQYDRIICTDVDVLFKGDISDTYFANPTSDFYVAGIHGVTENNLMTNYYINKFTREEQNILMKGIGAGYLVFNLKKIREDEMGTKMRSYYKNNLYRLVQPEQDVINLCCYPHVKILPFKYMVCTYFYKKKNQKIPFEKEIINAKNIFHEALTHPVQLHYAGYNKPWNSIFIRKSGVWFRELVKTGFLGYYLLILPPLCITKKEKIQFKSFYQ
jgi:Lipopolysaccharide biosynthesis proteins, LPS:glycosyltransferases